ncbi:hypothetical protein B0H13DRAFT_2284492 [Mycena leptocephala]|nr:hypothetical protein B0H13DRAFT_2284492 [Mycena leptocephala]
MGNCISNKEMDLPFLIVKQYIEEFDKQTDPVKLALQAAEARALTAEACALTAETALKKPKPGGPACSICFKHCKISVNPWLYTKNDSMVIPDSDDEGPPRKQVTHGIQLACQHCFCGKCLAQAIYRRLNIAFDRSTYGTVLDAPVAAVPGLRAEFPILCPTCQVKPGVQPVEISDLTAQLVLGEPNIKEWNHARYLSKLNLIDCPHKGCEETFPADNVAVVSSGVQHATTLVRCPSPRCRGYVCKAANLTCVAYRSLPLAQRSPEDLAFANLAKQEKWRECPKCLTMVELKYGCNHITCVCKHHVGLRLLNLFFFVHQILQFCYTCGADFETEGGKYGCTGGTGCNVWEEQNLLDY